MSRFTVLFSTLVTISGIAALLGLSGCKKDQPPSVVIIVTERMNVFDMNCANNEEQEGEGGFPVLCREFIRFTHAYTPSVLAVPTMTSLLTGQFPVEHRVRNNSQYISQTKLVSEIALERKFRTAFLSGGAPILRKTGLHHGFEIFDDGLGGESNLMFKPFKLSIERFKRWMNSEVGSDPIFVVFYVPDLLYTERITQDAFGEQRNRTFESQLEELNDGTSELFQYLKDQNRWDSTQIYFTSVSGRNTYGRTNEYFPLNLHSEVTQVPLFIKPAQKKRDEPSTWKIDQNVSLVDVGVTLISQLRGNISSFPKPAIKRYPLQMVLEKPGSFGDEERVIPLESGWGTQWGLWNVRTAFIRGYDLLFLNRQPLLYRTLSDRLELNPTKAGIKDISEELRSTVNIFAAEPWPKSKDAYRLLDLQAAITAGSETQTDRLTKDAAAYPVVWEVLDETWIPDQLLEQAFVKKDWKKLAEYARRFDRPMIASYAQNLSGAKADKNFLQPCYLMLKNRVAPGGSTSECQDKLVVELNRWMQKKETGSQFVNSYKSMLRERNFVKKNILLGQLWDMPTYLRLAPQEVELLLSLPENQSYARELTKLVNTSSPNRDLMENSY